MTSSMPAKRGAASKNARASLIGIAITSTIVLPATVAARDSGRRRVPWQSGQVLKLW